MHWTTRVKEAALGFNLMALPSLVRAGPRSCAAFSRRSYLAARQSVPHSDKIPVIELAEILGGVYPRITLRAVPYEEGMLPTQHCMGLLSILAKEQPKVILEIGTFMGNTTRQMAELLPDANIHTVDLPPSFDPEKERETLPNQIPKDDFHLIQSRIPGREFRDDPQFQDRIQQHFADTGSWDFQGVGSPSFFFIDGSHTYEYCKNDSEKCLAIASRPATFLWHDCDSLHPGVERFVMEWRAMGRDVRRIGGTELAYWRHQ